MRCIIVDDEQLARALLQKYVEKFTELELVGSFKNPMEALEFLKTNEVDLMLLDIQMPEITGIEMLQTMQNKPMVIFTTAYSEYALDGFNLDVLDYLVKPFPFDRFSKAIQKALEYHHLKTKASISNVSKDYLVVKADHRLHKIKFSDIKYIEGLREYVTFHLPEFKIVALESLKKLEEQLPSEDFLRVHKSFIIRKEGVTSAYGNMLEIGTKEIPIGKSYKEVVMKELF